MRSRVAALLVVLALVASGCHAAAANKVGRTVSPEAFDSWRSFPVDARPRPIILFDSPVRDPTDWTLRPARPESFVLAVPAPAAPTTPTMLANLPDGPAQLPLIGAQAGFTTLSREALAGYGGPVVRITAVALGTAAFPTDRGPVELPAWLFTPENLPGPIAVPAVAPSVFWEPNEERYLPDELHANAAADGRTLRVPVDDPYQCMGKSLLPPADVVETDAAVAVGTKWAPLPHGCHQSGIGVGRSVWLTVVLARPLGNRVLLDPAGGLIPVLSAATG